MRRAATALVFSALPGAAWPHSAFGDLGPFYANFLHPLADPAQGLVLAAVAVLLAAHPLGTVRPAYAALVAGAGAAILSGAALAVPGPGLRTLAVAATAIALLAIAPIRLGPTAVSAIAMVAGAAASLSLGVAPGLRDGGLGVVGGTLGVALFALLLWGLVDLARRRIAPVAGSVAASWVAAVGLMATVLPAA